MAKENALLVVPHQDDECNLAGNIISVLMDSWELFIVYSSLEADNEKAKIRKQEAINACTVWGINEHKLIFLNYPDTPNKARKHYYIDEGDLRIVDDLIKSIRDLCPEIIIGTDFDYHSDHRMLSLALDKALGKILKELKGYRPIVIKGFCYETAYYGIEDYEATAPGECKPKYEVLSNPLYEWDNRLSIKSDEKTGVIWRRKCYKALAKHKSQYAVLHARSIVNDDNVYWQRRTDNLALFSVINVTSGDEKKVNDFLIIDTNDIITIDPRKIDYSKAMWKPAEEDKHPTVEFEWDADIDADTIVLHGNPNLSHKQNLKMKIYSENQLLASVNELREFGRDTIIYFPRTSLKSLTLIIEEYQENFGLSEVEIFNGKFAVPALLRKEHDEPQYQKNRFMNAVNTVGYKLIVVFQKIKRKGLNSSG